MKGEIRNPNTVWLLTLLTCGAYGYYLIFTMGNELKAFLNKEELNPTMDVLLIFLTCGFFALYIPIKYGKLIQEAQLRAGIANAEDQGLKFLLFNFCIALGYRLMQEELNKVWDSGGAQPVQF